MAVPYRCKAIEEPPATGAAASLTVFVVVLAPCVTAPLASPADGPGGELRCGPGCGPGCGLRRCGPGGGLGGDQFV